MNLTEKWWDFEWKKGTKAPFERGYPRFDITLTQESWDIVEEDMDNFIEVDNLRKISSFFTHILINFNETASSTIDKQLDIYVSDLRTKLLPNNLKDEVSEAFIKKLKEAKSNELNILAKHNENSRISNRATNKNRPTFSLNEKSFELLYHLNEYKYYSSPKSYINNLISEYTNLSRDKREQIFFKEKIDAFNEALSLKCKIEVTRNNNSNNESRYITEYVIPVKMLTDKFNNYTYFICALENENGDLRTISYRLSKITSLKICKSKTKSLSKSEKDKCYKDVRERGMAYLVNGVLTCKIKFSQRGLKSLKNQIYMRPNVISKEDNIITFSCTYTQARNYFFKMESEIEVLEPANLREAMFKKYKSGMTQYISDEDKEKIEEILFKKFTT